MIKLKIVEKRNYNYKLVDEEKEKYSINIELLDIEETLKVGDYIYMDKDLLNPKYEGYSTSYTFGTLDNRYGKDNILIDDIDVIKVVIGEIEIYLKRLYG